MTNNKSCAHRNSKDCITGISLEGKSRKIYSARDIEDFVIVGNTSAYYIDRAGGIIASCKINKKSDLRFIPSHLLKLAIFTEKDNCLEGDLIYCECQDCKRGLISLSAAHRGQIGVFQSKKAAFSAIFKVFTQTKVYRLTEPVSVKDFKEKN